MLPDKLGKGQLVTSPLLEDMFTGGIGAGGILHSPTPSFLSLRRHQPRDGSLRLWRNDTTITLLSLLLELIQRNRLARRVC